MSHSAGTTNVELDESLPPTEHQSDPFPQPTNLDRIAEASLIADSGAPDGGYGWVVISGCSVITWWFVGTSYCWGVVQAALVDRKLSSPSTLSFVGSMTCAFIAVLAIVNARVIRAIGSRNTGLLGISFLGLGQVLSGFSTHNVGVLFLTTGILMGVGTRSVNPVIRPHVSKTNSNPTAVYVSWWDLACLALREYPHAHHFVRLSRSRRLSISTRNVALRMASSLRQVASAAPSSVSPWTA